VQEISKMATVIARGSPSDLEAGGHDSRNGCRVR